MAKKKWIKKDSPEPTGSMMNNPEITGGPGFLKGEEVLGYRPRTQTAKDEEKAEKKKKDTEKKLLESAAKRYEKEGKPYAASVANMLKRRYGKEAATE